MLVIVIGLGLAAGLAYFNRRTAGKDKVPWREDLTAAVAEARAAGKPMMLDFTAHWCGPCQEMRLYTWSNSQVADAITGTVVPVKVDFDKNPQLVAKYQVEAIPTMIIVNADGVELKRETGELSADQFLAWLKQ
jgi:thiol:disulfide interchange protein